MASFTNQTVTIDGRKLLVDCLTGTKSIVFTAFAIGDGEAPAAPENCKALIHELFRIPVSKTSANDKENGVTLVQGSFKNNNEKGDFYWRELGLYARAAGTEETPILFGYINMGETADYIPSAGIGSYITQGILLQVVTGSAPVLYVTDPTAAATLKDIEDCIAEVEAKLSAFSKEHLATIEAQIAELQAGIDTAIEELNKATEGYVLKAGDTMTGDLNMGTNKVIGTATQWAGWKLYSGLSEISGAFDDSSKIVDIARAMSEKSRLLHMTGNVITVSDDGMPEIGLLEIVKFNNSRCACTFTDADGRRYHSATDETEPRWKGWILEEAAPVGSVQIFAGATEPGGYILCDGRTLSRFAYSSLFAVIGYLYGGEGDNFKVPDFRGVFPRGYDAGAGVDAGRKLGTYQDSGAPNITGEVTNHACVGLTQSSSLVSGAFTLGQYRTYAPEGHSAFRGYGIKLDASRVSSVYQNDLTEIRPRNVAVNFIIKY